MWLAVAGVGMFMKDKRADIQVVLADPQVHLDMLGTGHSIPYLWTTAKSAYKEPAYKELPVIRNGFSFPNL